MPFSPTLPAALRAITAMLLCGGVLSACASVPKARLDDVRRDVRQRGALRVEWVTDAQADSTISEWVGRTLTGEVPIDTAVQIGLLRNKHLQAAFEDLGIAQADLLQAGLLANPVISAGNARARGGGPGIQSLGVVLPFIDILQRPARKRVAVQELAAARARTSATILSLATEIRVAYIDAQAAEQMLELRRTANAALAASATAASALHDAGNLADFDLAQEQAMAANAQLEVFRSEAEVLDTRAELERVMGVQSGVLRGLPWTLTPRLATPSDSTDARTELTQIALARRLDLQAARSDAAAAAARLGLTRTFALLPDGTIGAGFERDPDGTFVGGTTSIPIPLFDRGQARVARNRAALRQTVARHDALVQDITAETRQLRARLAAARAREDHLRRVVLPLRHQALVESQKFVNAMEHSVFTLLLVRQAEIDAGQAYIEALRDYWRERARLERAVGGSLSPLSPEERAAPAVGAPVPPRSTPPQ